jgi:hypothetical protein
LKCKATLLRSKLNILFHEAGSPVSALCKQDGETPHAAPQIVNISSIEGRPHSFVIALHASVVTPLPQTPLSFWNIPSYFTQTLQREFKERLIAVFHFLPFASIKLVAPFSSDATEPMQLTGIFN